MSRIIAVANQKGGVGKTTTTVNLSAALASMHKKVLLIDLDPQGNATMGCGIEKHEVDKGIFDVLVDGMPVAEACHTSPENGCSVLPANSDLTAAEVELMSMEEREQRLHQALSVVRNNYDYVLIDCPPSLNILTLNAFVAADSVLVPIQCEYYALEGLSALLETIEGVRETVNPDIAIEGLLRTMYDGRNKLGVEVSAQLIEHFGDQVFRTVVPRNVRLAEAPSHGLSIMEYDRTSRGALAYLALAGEIVRQRARAAAKPNPMVVDATAQTDGVSLHTSTSEDQIAGQEHSDTQISHTSESDVPEQDAPPNTDHETEQQPPLEPDPVVPTNQQSSPEIPSAEQPERHALPDTDPSVENPMSDTESVNG